MTTDPLDLDRFAERHAKRETWDSGNPEAVDGWITWCGFCGQRPWPCDAAALVRELREARAAYEALLFGDKP